FVTELPRDLLEFTIGGRFSGSRATNGSHFLPGSKRSWRYNRTNPESPWLATRGLGSLHAGCTPSHVHRPEHPRGDRCQWGRSMICGLTQVFSPTLRSPDRTQRRLFDAEALAGPQLRGNDNLPSSLGLRLSLVHGLYAQGCAVRTRRVRAQDPSSIISRSGLRRPLGEQAGLVLVSPRSSPS